MKAGGSLFALAPEPALKLTEDDIEEQVIKFLGFRGWLVKRQHVIRVKSQSGNWITIGERGDPDYIALHSRFPAFAIETKRPGRHADPHQLAKHDEYQFVWKIPVAVIDSLEALRAFLAEHERVALAQWASAAPGCDVRP
jgi:hypothetical protein